MRFLIGLDFYKSPKIGSFRVMEASGRELSIPGPSREKYSRARPTSWKPRRSSPSEDADDRPEPERLEVRCYNCQTRGNRLSKDCPKPRQIRCWTCGEKGHAASACPKSKTSDRLPSKVSKAVNVRLVSTELDLIYRRKG